MIICHSRRFVLIRPRKVASSSVQGAFLPHLAAGDQVMRLDPHEIGLSGATVGYDRRAWPFVLRQHSSLARLVRVMGRGVLDYRIITLARNPWDRALSEFFYDGRAEGLRALTPEAQKVAFAEWLQANARLPLMKRLAYRMVGDWRESKLEQAALCTYEGRFRADHVIFYEDLQGGLDEVGQALGITLRLPARKAKAGIRSEESRDWRAFYDAGERDLIGRCCREDIALFGYDFDGTARPALHGALQG